MWRCLLLKLPVTFTNAFGNKEIKHSIELVCLSIYIEFNHRYFYMCMPLLLCEFTFQFKINRNFMFSIDSVWTSTRTHFPVFCFQLYSFLFFVAHRYQSSLRLFWQLFELVHEFLIPFYTRWRLYIAWIISGLGQRNDNPKHRRWRQWGSNW